jgi:hypothetical protein
MVAEHPQCIRTLRRKVKADARPRLTGAVEAA